MSQTSFRQKFLRATGRNALFMTRWIIRFLPYPVFRFFISIFISVGRPIINKKRRIAVENLHTAFDGEKTDQEINTIADHCFDSLGSGMIELIYFLDRPKEVLGKVTIEGKENLDAALKKGNGVILLSAHFGNFILMYLRIALAGYKTNCIMRRVRDEQFEKYISDFRNENGIQTIYSLPHRQCVGNSLKRLRDNQILFILLDQNYGEEGGVFVDFFGQPAATATGPVVFSNRSGAPILPVFIVGNGENRYKIIIDPPVKLEGTEDGKSELVNNVAQLTKIIEKYIRLYPHEWGGWLHRRWKTKLAIPYSASP